MENSSNVPERRRVSPQRPEVFPLVLLGLAENPGQDAWSVGKVQPGTWGMSGLQAHCSPRADIWPKPGAVGRISLPGLAVWL